MRFIARFFGLIFATGAIVFRGRGDRRRRGDLQVRAGTCRTTPSSRNYEPPVMDPRPTPATARCWRKYSHERRL